MRRRLLAFGIALALMAGSLTAIAQAGANEVPVMPAAVAVAGTVRLKASAEKPAYRSGETAMIEVTATNAGHTVLEYWLPTPCDSPFRVTIRSQDGVAEIAPVRSLPAGQRAEPGTRPDACPMVVKRIALGPGQSYTGRFVWEISAAETAPGDYLVTVEFDAPEEGGAPPVGVSVPLRVLGISDSTGHWAEEQIRRAVRLGIANGYPGGQFLPDREVTRAELIKLLVAARGLRAMPPERQVFADTSRHWVEQQGYLGAALEALLLHPEDYQSRLVPDAVISRKEAALMVVRALAQERRALGLGTDRLRFTDRQLIPTWAAGYIVTAHAEGVITGYADGSFRPDRPVTRAEAVTMALRMVDALSVWIDRSAAVRAGTRLISGVAAMERHPRLLAPLAPVAEAVGIRVTPDEGGWIHLSHGTSAVRVKPGVPYLLRGGKPIPLDVATPMQVNGMLYVPEAVLSALGIGSRWDALSRTLQLTSPDPVAANR